ncbi:hypothetical protein HHK36_021893 [Tetracentron sinense]|uniref:DUF985 domain-containing protein n=1 Tax=Tetracentron sinense TaxID=13715 RepID=A0A835DAD7_TETSI|nr:hypothetical protein HHK36_021893 [Tetracentron sinense]
MASASEIAAKLNLQPHPEGDKVDRPISTSIYFLLPSGSVSRLHRIPCAETWHFYKGEPITVVELNDDGDIKMTCLGSDLGAGQQPQYTVAPNVWFGSFPTKDFTISPDGGSLVKASPRDVESHYSLVGCTCAPAFQYQDFELGKRSELLARFPKVESLISYLTVDD